MCVEGSPGGVASDSYQERSGACGHDSVLSPHQVEYKRGHDERVSRFTPVADTPELLRAQAGTQLHSDVSTDEG